MVPLKQALTIIKIGGKLIDNEIKLSSILHNFAAIPTAKILVHGGGKKANELAQQLQIPVNIVDGRRITDKATLALTTMVYAGLINKQIVAQLQALSCNALGLSGADMNLIKAHQRLIKKINYGYVGDIDRVNHTRIEHLLQENTTPVFCAITHNKKGQLLNTNADTIAAQIAIAMAPYYQCKLIYCFEKNGVLSDPLSDESLITKISLDNYDLYKKQGIIKDGMIPKMDNAFHALQNNVSEVFIGGTKAITSNFGTQLCL